MTIKSIPIESPTAVLKEVAVQPGHSTLTRAQRRVINRAESAKRYAEREARKTEKRAILPPDSIGRARGRGGAGAREGGVNIPPDPVGGVTATASNPSTGLVVLADQDLSTSAELSTGSHLPTDEKRQAVVVMRANGFTRKAIAAVLGLEERALKNHYGFEIEHGFALVATKIASAVTLSALNGDQKDQHFWLRSKLGWGGDRAVNITMGVMEAQISPNATKPWPGGVGLPAPGPNGKIQITMRLGIPGDNLGDDDDHEADR